MNEETNAVVGWKNGTVIDGKRKGSAVVVAPMNAEGVHQVIFATGASAWYLPEDLHIEGHAVGASYDYTE